MALWKTIFQHCQRNSVAILVQLTHLITPFSNKTAISPQSLQEMVTFIHSTINYDIPMSHLFDILPFSLSSTLFKLIGLMFFIAASSGSQWWTRDSSVNIWFLLVLPDLCNMRWLFFYIHWLEFMLAEAHDLRKYIRETKSAVLFPPTQQFLFCS